jgi:hypothetical protein
MVSASCWAVQNYGSFFHTACQLHYSVTGQVLGRLWRPKFKDSRCDNALPGQGYRVTQGVIMDECEAMVEWWLAGEKQGHFSCYINEKMKSNHFLSYPSVDTLSPVTVLSLLEQYSKWWLRLFLIVSNNKKIHIFRNLMIWLILWTLMQNSTDYENLLQIRRKQNQKPKR